MQRPRDSQENMVSITRHQAAGAYRRWTPEDFTLPASDADSAAGAAHDAEPPGEDAAALELPPDLKLPTAAELEQMQEDMRAAAATEGHQEGHAAGYAEGLAAGEQKGYEEGRARAAAEAEQLGTLVTRLDAALSTIDQQVAEELMALAIELARQLVGDSLQAQPEHILLVVRRALQQLPQAQARIELHADDLALVNEFMSEELAQYGHRVQENPLLQRGDCRIEVQGAELDATLETRWRRVLETLGREGQSFRPGSAAGADAEHSALAEDGADSDTQPVAAARRPDREQME